MEKETKNKMKSVMNFIGYVAGSAVLFVAAVAILPEVMPKVSGKINKELAKASNAKADDDWGPVIERKNREE